MKTGINMDKKSDNIQIDLKTEQESAPGNRRLCIGLTTIMVIFVAVSTAMLVTYFCFLKRPDIQETDAVFITKDGESIQEHIKLTDTEVILSGDGSTLIYDHSKGLKIYHWDTEDALHDACYVESFNVSKFTSLDQLKSMMTQIKPDQPKEVDRSIEETFVSTDITLNNLALGLASRDMCKNKKVFFLQRVPDLENRGRKQSVK